MGDTALAGAWLVRIEIQRIQTFLFSIPRLRAMLGANALLGHELRHLLPSKANGTFPCTYGPHPALAVQDPLGQSAVARAAAHRARFTDLDDPAECYRHGVLARDGGHLHLLFRDEPDARLYYDLVRQRLADRLPGLRYGIQIGPVDDRTGPLPAQAPEAAQVDDLPQFQVCEASGSGPAASRSNEKNQPRSRAASLKLGAGKAFQEGRGGYRDPISLLRPLLPGYCDPERQPDDLEDLADEGRYIALLHADGNRVGSRLTAYRDRLAGRPWIERASGVEHFFHAMRTSVRRALVDALDRVFPLSELERDDTPQKKAKLGYQLLMLGGDDILLVCRPRYALPFVVELACGLAAHRLPDGAPLSIGAGVAIAKHNLPFHRLHTGARPPRSQLKALAQDLAGGRRWAELRYREVWERLPEPARAALESVARAGSPWLDLGEGRYLTRIKDLIEVYELRYLGRRKQEDEEDEHAR